jgi:signal transduction histidine kinase
VGDLVTRAPEAGPVVGPHPARDAWAEFWRTPPLMRAYLLAVAATALVLPVVVSRPVHTPFTGALLTVTALFLVSVLNVELSRWLSGGLTRANQPHKALSAWAFASAMLLPAAWLLVVVPVTYAHARWRGIRVPLWKWIGSACYLILCGLAAAAVRQHFLGGQADWSQGDGHRGFVTMSAALAVFLALETLLFAGSVLLNDTADEVWLRAILTSATFYVTEAGVLLLGGLFSMVWTASFWFTLFFVPVYILIQHVVLLGPLRERAAVAVELTETNAELARLNAVLAEKNAELDHSNRFTTDLIGMLGHEIGNPLTSVLGYAQVGSEAAARGDAAAAAEALAVVDRNAQKVSAVLDEIIRVVASEAGTLVAAPEALAVARRLDQAVSDLAGPHRPLVECPADLQVHVQPSHFDQILANLLNNADKYGGGATYLGASPTAAGHVEICVRDDGPGIPDAFMPQLFQRYRRDARTATSVPGTGLGLFISRELARANGGDLTHRRRSPAGAEFVLRLPAH